MYSNKDFKKFYGIKNRITITFSFVFIFITLFSTVILFLILNGQNNNTLVFQYSAKVNEINAYFSRIEDYTNKYNEKKLKLKFEPEIKEQSIVYPKPFNPGEEDFRYILHIVSKNYVDVIPINTSGFEININNLSKTFGNIKSNILIPNTIVLNNNSTESSNFSVVKLTKNIKGAIFEIYILKNIDQHVKTINTLKILFLVSALLGLILIFLTSRVISNRILKPIKNIIKTSKEISSGDLSRRIPNFEVKDELYDLTNIINEMLDKINLTFDKQSRFISDVSHELRTPISIIKGYAELINRRYIKSLTKEEIETPRNELLIESTDSIVKESENMTKLITSLLFLSRGDENNIKMLNKVNVNSSKILHQIESDYSLVTQNKKVLVERNDNFEFISDENLLLQSLRIVIENGLKYSPDNSNVYISSIYDKNENTGYFVVRDEGFGIDEDQIEKIFDRFYRVDESRNKETGGNGLGLSIFKRILEIQNQKYTMESKINVGTKITIIINNISNN
ncbi:HAMP domain-containing sensor histidine kinase [Streptobacillus felis]|uniref:histidine kinase n=1 Tax=Streptobacillus felis TaxID=1384509 RepID=A0A7Z0PDW3_9FUSO|nr:HAMP domain-containing sensor histidine kinase [Streptobacillus felis]NYV27459.1 HAMP domain-containing histidine kinase [Streptobacillus felis]